MSNDAFDQYTARVVCIKYLQFYYKHIIRSEKNEPSQYCAVHGYPTLIIQNDYWTSAYYYGVSTAFSFLLIYVLVNRQGLGNNVRRDAALPW